MIDRPLEAILWSHHKGLQDIHDVFGELLLRDCQVGSLEGGIAETASVLHYLGAGLRCDDPGLDRADALPVTQTRLRLGRALDPTARDA